MYPRSPAARLSSRTPGGTSDFTATLAKQLSPYAVQGARKLTVDRLTLYARINEKLVPASPAVDLAALPAGVSGPSGEAPLTLPADGTVLTRDPSAQVYLLLQYQFGMS